MDDMITINYYEYHLHITHNIKKLTPDSHNTIFTTAKIKQIAQ